MEKLTDTKLKHFHCFSPVFDEEISTLSIYSFLLHASEGGRFIIYSMPPCAQEFAFNTFHARNVWQCFQIDVLQSRMTLPLVSTSTCPPTHLFLEKGTCYTVWGCRLKINLTSSSVKKKGYFKSGSGYHTGPQTALLPTHRTGEGRKWESSENDEFCLFLLSGFEHRFRPPALQSSLWRYFTISS